MTYGQTLIDKAAQACGSRYKVAEAMGLDEASLSKAARGLRPVPLEWVPTLAALAGEDARDALARAMAEKLPEGSLGRRALGGVFAAGVAAMLLFSHARDASAATMGVRGDRAGLHSLYIVECLRRVLGAASRRVRRPSFQALRNPQALRREALRRQALRSEALHPQALHL